MIASVEASNNPGLINFIFYGDEEKSFLWIE